MRNELKKESSLQIKQNIKYIFFLKEKSMETDLAITLVTLVVLIIALTLVVVLTSQKEKYTEALPQNVPENDYTQLAGTATGI